MEWQTYMKGRTGGDASRAKHADPGCVACFGDLRREYDALGDGPAIVDRSYRHLLEISGTDRAAWLHNLTTQEVRNLRQGEGSYAFALNAQGRILFDLNILVRSDVIWIDLDRRFTEAACRHFEKYIITEDVSVADRTEEFVRLGLVGENAKRLVSDLGAPQAPAMPWCGTAKMTHGGAELTFLRHDFCGPFGVELFVPADRAVGLWEGLSASSQVDPAVPAGYDAVQVRRIEAGLPWPCHEITDEYLPAETGQLDRAVSFTKGCYLGQEVVERMRSRDVVARQMIGVLIAGQEVPPTGAELATADGRRVGTLTSVCRALVEDRVIGLGYVKTAEAVAETPLQVTWAGGAAEAVVRDFPSRALRAEPD